MPFQRLSTPATVTWTTVAAAHGYDLVIGTTAYGSNLANSGILPPSESSYNVAALPAGKNLYATLLTLVNGTWGYQAIIFTAS